MPSKVEEAYKLKRKVAGMKQFDLKCRVCHKKYGKNFTFHHKKYVTGEQIYKDFRSTHDYNLYILPRIEQDPNRFVLLCGAHHTLVEKLKRFKKDKLKRLFDVVNESE
tara:strand:- start:885 stop:1208 length:324 start_codon:yes stop_codon:yes gene_type:complete